MKENCAGSAYFLLANHCLLIANRCFSTPNHQQADSFIRHRCAGLPPYLQSALDVGCPGWITMLRGMMAWVWFTVLTLARLNIATDLHLGGRPAALEAQCLGTGPPRGTEGGENSYYAPVWTSLEGSTPAWFAFEIVYWNVIRLNVEYTFAS